MRGGSPAGTASTCRRLHSGHLLLAAAPQVGILAAWMLGCLLLALRGFRNGRPIRRVRAGGVWRLVRGGCQTKTLACLPRSDGRGSIGAAVTPPGYRILAGLSGT